MDSPLGAFIAPKPPQTVQTLNSLTSLKTLPRPLQRGQKIMPYLSGFNASGGAFFRIFRFLAIILKMDVLGLPISDVKLPAHRAGLRGKEISF